jgi:hypothetical protein
MNTTKKLGIIVAGFAAFVVGSVVVTLVSSAVSALVPGRTPDPPGNLEPSPEEKAKADWEAKMGKSQETQPKDDTKEEPTDTKEDSQPAEPPADSAQQSISEPSPPVAPPTPPRVSTGPGNFDAPAYVPPPPPPSVGPGNL